MACGNRTAFVEGELDEDEFEVLGGSDASTAAGAIGRACLTGAHRRRALPHASLVTVVEHLDALDRVPAPASRC